MHSYKAPITQPAVHTNCDYIRIMRHCLLSIGLCVLLSGPCTAQSTFDNIDWSDVMHDEDLTLEEMRLLHEQAWPIRPEGRGRGYKPFQRFLSMQQGRINNDGRLVSGEDVLEQKRSLDDALNTRSLTGNWYPLGPIIDDVTTHEMIEGVGRMQTIAFHPTNPMIVFAGAPAGGVWRSLDGGLTWSTNTDTLPTLGISSIAFDTNNPNTIYAGTGDRDASDAPGMGVIKSTDGGETWTFVNVGIANATVGCMRFQSETGHLFIGTDDGFYRTTDGGMTWELMSNNTNSYKDFELHPTLSNVIYTTSAGKFFRSEDGGQTWDWVSEVLSSGARMNIAVTPADPDVVYVIKTGTYEFSGLYRSTDAGLTFTEMSTEPNIMGWAADGSSAGGQAWYDLCMEADHNNPMTVYVGGIRIKRSLDGGSTWEDIQPNYVHVDQHEMVISHHNQDLYVCNDGGLYHYSENQNWVDISKGIVTGQIYQLGQSPHNPNHTLTGYQDNGTMEFDGVYWRRRGGGDGFECAYDHTTPDWRYGSIYYGETYRTTPEVVNEKIAGLDVLGIDEEGAWNTPYFISRADSTANTMFIGLKNVWRSTNIKEANKDDIIWEKISNNLSSNTANLVELEQCISNKNILYASKDNRKLFRTNNALSDSVIWTNLSLNLPVAQVTVNAIETSPLDSNLLWIGYNKNVYRSSNQGSSWTNITLNFPDIVINSVVMDTTNAGAEALYIGTDMGVYYKDTTLANFVPFGDGLPTNARITELEIYYGQSISEHRIKASTYGRGLWESDLYSTQTQNFPPVASITLPNGENETFGEFTAQVIFYKSLNEVDMTGFSSPLEDVIVSNGYVTAINGGPSAYQVTIAPLSFGEVALHIPNDAGFDAFNMGNFASDTLRVYYLPEEAPFGRFGPAGIGDETSLAIWLRGDLGVNQNASQQVNAWNDQGGGGLQAFQSLGSNRPTWLASGIAGRPALSFDGEDDMLQIEGMRPGRSMSAFIIVETDTIKFNDHGWFASSRMDNGYLMHPWKNDYYYHNEVIDNSGDYSGINSFYIGDASAPHIYGFVYHQDDIHQTMTTHFDEDPYPQPGVNIGWRDPNATIQVDMGHDFGYDNDRYGKGRIAEHVVFNRRLMRSHVRILQNYFAVRYGIDFGPNALYNLPNQQEEIFGIGRTSEYDAHLDAQGRGIIRLQAVSGLESGAFLLLGNDTNSTNWIDNTYPFSTGRMARTWGFMQTGNTGLVRLSMRVQDLPNEANLGVIVSESDEFNVNQNVAFYPLMLNGDSAFVELSLPARGVFTIGQFPMLGVTSSTIRTPRIYPNPAQEMMRIDLPISAHEMWEWRCYDAAGHWIDGNTVYDAKCSISVQDWSTGLYLLEIRTQDGQIHRQRVIIQH